MKDLPIAELLMRSCTVDELASALNQHDGMRLIVPVGKFRESVEDSSALQDCYALHSEQGQNPLAFTSDEFASACAAENQWVDSNNISMFVTLSWITGIQEFLWRKDVGVIIDHGTEH